ncbi:peptide-methionine (S)-S-oxide reductase [Undibacterium arcticum]
MAHDPTQLNRQFPDSGTQYRSAVFTGTPTRNRLPNATLRSWTRRMSFHAKIVTQLSPLSAFYPAEAYHQDYATLHPESGYIATYDLPKISNLKKHASGSVSGHPRAGDITGAWEAH